MARVLFTTFGSYGDVHPYLAVGLELKARGHAVTIATSEFYRAKVESEGLAFHAVKPDLDLGHAELMARVNDARRSTQMVLQFTSEHCRASYQTTLPAIRQADVVVTHFLSFGAVAAAEELGVPWISTSLAPVCLLSATDPPVPPGREFLLIGRYFGPGLMRSLLNWGKRLSASWLREAIALRKECGVSALNPVFDGAWSPRLHLAMFSRHFSSPQADWPVNTVATGFPFFDQDRGQKELAPELDRFLDAGAPPVIFTLGTTAVQAAGRFYRESLDAVARLRSEGQECRAILLTGSGRQELPEQLPEGTMAASYAPYSQVFPRCSAIVHPAGIGTTAQVLRSGRPSLIVPFANDQFDNAYRARRLGVAEVLKRERYDGRRAAAALGKLLTAPSYLEKAGELGERIRGENGAVEAAERIERAMAWDTAQSGSAPRRSGAHSTSFSNRGRASRVP